MDSFWSTGIGGLIQKLYRMIPPGHLRVLIKNIVSFIAHHFAFSQEEIMIDGISLKVYKGNITQNSSLIKDILGYNRHYKLKKGDIVIDGGAYNGLFTIYAAKKVGPSGRVIALEPDRYNALILEKNIALNNLTNVAVVKKGLYDRDTTVKFDIQDASSRIVEEKDAISINSIDVTTVDTLVKQYTLPKVNFIKMDIEGAEVHAIHGCSQTMKSNPPLQFAIASYHIVDGEKTCTYLEREFSKKQWKAVTEYEEHLTTYAYQKITK